MNPLGYKVDYTAPVPADDDSDTTLDITKDVGLMLTKYGTYSITYSIKAFKIRMNLDFKANRKRTETVTAVVTAGVQRELSDSAESDRESISLTSQTVAEGVDPDGALPIGALSYRSYFQTERGAASFEYLLLAARAKCAPARGPVESPSPCRGPRRCRRLAPTSTIPIGDCRKRATGKVKSYKPSAAARCSASSRSDARSAPGTSWRPSRRQPCQTAMCARLSVAACRSS
jgi:hypothetical protein